MYKDEDYHCAIRGLFSNNHDRKCSAFEILRDIPKDHESIKTLSKVLLHKLNPKFEYSGYTRAKVLSLAIRLDIIPNKALEKIIKDEQDIIPIGVAMEELSRRGSSIRQVVSLYNIGRESILPEDEAKELVRDYRRKVIEDTLIGNRDYKEFFFYGGLAYTLYWHSRINFSDARKRLTRARRKFEVYMGRFRN